MTAPSGVDLIVGPGNYFAVLTPSGNTWVMENEDEAQCPFCLYVDVVGDDDTIVELQARLIRHEGECPVAIVDWSKYEPCQSCLVSQAEQCIHLHTNEPIEKPHPGREKIKDK